MFDTSASGSGEPAEAQGTPAAPVTPAVGPLAGRLVEPAPDADRPNPSGPSGSSPIADFAVLLAGLPQDIPDRELLDRIRELEDLKAAASAAQARASAAFDASQRATQSKAGTAREKLGEGVASQIALARRDSPARGNRHLGMAHALTKEMPHTLAALSTGILSEWRATLLVRETACLDAENRARVDETLAADPSTLEGLGDKRLIAAAKKEAYRLDPHTVVRRAAKAANERTVTTRPAPDTMTYVTALLPVAQGVAVQAALERAANQLRAAGDERGRGQIMADTLVNRITDPADRQTGPQDRTQDGKPGATGGADLEIQLVMTDRALLAGDHEPAHLTGYGTVPSGWARDLILGPRTTSQSRTPAGQVEQAGEEARIWVRRLYTAPGTGELIAMDSTARIFPKNLRKLIITRDQTCRTPWCDAPIRQIDHVLSHGVGGQTNETNGSGLCERCNQAKTATGHHAIPIPGSRHTIEITTPTGHLYHSTAPPLPGTGTPALPSTATPALPETEPRSALPKNTGPHTPKGQETKPPHQTSKVPPLPQRPPRIGRNGNNERRTG